ncbi:hypothetical protein [Cryobacterium sp. N22]|uniref:hypothetical protein n=1 Tax=Cryobacterium sp. N22 TaxID=2048290 RepID=UPI000CE360D4|nr:hypothetical protein [Cryobacterium sp. N22]
MTDTTPPEGNKNHNADAPTEHIYDDQSPEPTTVADPSKTVDEPAREHAAETSTPEPAYVPGEPIDYEPAAPATVNASEAPTEKVERLTAEPTPAEVARDEAVAKQKDYTPTYVPTPAATTAPAVAQATVEQPVQQQTQQFSQSPVYVTAPTPPKTLGNRAAGILIGLIATAVFAVVYAVIAFFISAANAASVADATSRFTDFLVLPVFYVPVIFFFLAFALLVAVLNRAGWWAYVLGGFLVAVVVYFSYIGGALLAVQAWNLTPAEAARFVSTQWLNPGAIAAAIVAREVPIWFGAWIARRGRSITAKNIAAKAEYERQLAEGPQLARSV